MSAAIDALNAEYQRTAKRMGIPEGDAHEALATTRDYRVRAWLCDFILRYEATELAENYPPTSEAAVFAKALIDILGMPLNARIDGAHHFARAALRRVRDLTNGSAAS